MLSKKEIYQEPITSRYMKESCPTYEEIVNRKEGDKYYDIKSQIFASLEEHLSDRNNVINIATIRKLFHEKYKRVYSISCDKIINDYILDKHNITAD